MIKIFIALIFVTSVVAQTTTELKNHITRYEGYSLHSYYDKFGNLSIGIGHKINKNEKLFYITPFYINILFENDLNIAIKAANNELIDFNLHPEIIKIIIIALIFNIGQNGFHQFYEFRMAINKHDYNMAANALSKSLWAKELRDRAIDYEKILKKCAPPQFLVLTF